MTLPAQLGVGMSEILWSIAIQANHVLRLIELGERKLKS